MKLTRTFQIYICLLVSAFAGSEAPTQSSFKALKEAYETNKIQCETKAGEAILDMGRLRGSEEVFRFLYTLYHYPANPNMSFGRKYPEVRSLDGYPPQIAYRAWAHSALVEWGYEPAIKKLDEEIRNEEKIIRAVALDKARLLKGENAMEIISRFIGDNAGGTPFGPLEWEALEELTIRLDNPPLPWSVEAKDWHDAYYKEGGREAWLKWRYENFGPIPGREDLFTQFATSNREPASSAPIESSAEAIEDTIETDQPAEGPTERGITRPVEEDDEQSSKWLIWLICAALVAGGITILRSRKR
jgi:hypothetical protein